MEHSQHIYDGPVQDEDFREIPAALSALEETIGSLQAEWSDLAQRLTPICSPAADEKVPEELVLAPSSDVAQRMHAMEARISRLRNAIYDTRRRVQV